MDLNNVLPILLELLSQQTSKKPEPAPQPQPEYYAPPAPNPNDNYWQLPSYSYSDPAFSQKSGFKKINNSCPNGQCGQYKKQNRSTGSGGQEQYQNNAYASQDGGQNGYNGSYGTGSESTQAGSPPQFDMSAILKLLTQLAPFFPRKREVQTEETEKEVSPSYISKLPRTDRWTFE